MQSHQLIRVSNPRPIAVVIPARSHSSVNPRPLDQPDRASRILEDDDVSDSVPSDDENYADYTENNETQEAEEQLPPSKWRRKNNSLDEGPSQSRRLGRLSSEPSRCEESEYARQVSSLESEPIPVQGFLSLRHCGLEVIYCL